MAALTANATSGGAAPAWEAWALAGAPLPAQPRLLAASAAERYLVVCGGGGGGGGCVTVACRESADGTHMCWAVGGQLAVRHAAWHPLSADHLLLLRADGVLGMYHLRNIILMIGTLD